mgnify:CR=1 FL=1
MAVQTVRVALAGGGAFGAKHAAALSRIEGVEVTAVVSADLAADGTAGRRRGAGPRPNSEAGRARARLINKADHATAIPGWSHRTDAVKDVGSARRCAAGKLKLRVGVASARGGDNKLL